MNVGGWDSTPSMIVAVALKIVPGVEMTLALTLVMVLGAWKLLWLGQRLTQT